MGLLLNIIENQKYAKQALVSSLSLYGKAAYYMDKKYLLYYSEPLSIELSFTN